MMAPPAPFNLTDGDLELVVPDASHIDDMLAAMRHPATVRDMPSLSETTRKQLLDFIARTPRGFDVGDPTEAISPAYHFWMRLPRTAALSLPIVGGLGLRIDCGPNIERVIGHIGYHVYPFARGHHYAERACRLLLPIARQHGINPLWITCNPDNFPSRRTCERLGATLIETLPVPTDHPLFAAGETQKCRYRLFL